MTNDRVQINVRVSKEQNEKIEDYVEDDDTGHNTKSDLIRSATMDYIEEGATGQSLDEIDAVATQLSRIERNVSELTRGIEGLQETQLDTDDVNDSVDSTVRTLLYQSIVSNDRVEGVSLKNE